MRQNFIAFLGNQRRWVLVSIGLLGSTLIGVGDYFASGKLLELSAFFVLPVSFFAWFVNRRAGLMASISSAAIILLVDLHSPLQRLDHRVAYWNSIVWLSLFCLITFLVTRLKLLHIRERELARVDNLTGIATRVAFYEFAEAELSRARRFRLPTSVAYLDLDSFKEVNDKNGHATGDMVLVTVARSLQKSIRHIDIVARVGGDEFALILPNTSAAAARTVLDKLLARLSRSMRQHHWPITFSIGAATFLIAPESVDKMVQRADEIMYSVKQAGKNNLRQEELAA